MSNWMLRMRSSAILTVVSVLFLFAIVVASTLRAPQPNLGERIDPDAVDTGFVQEAVFKDGGFESSDAIGPSWEWNHSMSESNGTYEICKEAPRSGDACVRISGKGAWGVLSGKSTVSAPYSAIRFQASVRVIKGRGLLQINYIRDGKVFANSYSEKVETPGEWTSVTLESDPVLLSQATSVVFGLAAGGGNDPYVVDFDDVEVDVRK